MMIPLLVLSFRILLTVLFGVMALLSIDKLHEFCQEHYKSARRLFKSLSLLSAGMHLLVARDVWIWHWIYSVGTALLYVRLADGIHTLGMKDILGNLMLTVVNHFLWFKHFLSKDECEVETVTACYVLLVWMLPVMYLAACTTDATHLPTFDGIYYLFTAFYKCRREGKTKEFNNKSFYSDY